MFAWPRIIQHHIRTARRAAVALAVLVGMATLPAACGQAASPPSSEPAVTSTPQIRDTAPTSMSAPGPGYRFPCSTRRRRGLSAPLSPPRAPA